MIKSFLFSGPNPKTSSMTEPSNGRQSVVSVAHDLEQLSREELVEHIRRQNEYIKKQSEQIRELEGRRSRQNGDQSSLVAKKNKNVKEFDFSKYQKKHVALKFFYLGSSLSFLDQFE